MKELAADGISVAVTCRVLKLARQPYYRWLAKPVTDAEYLEARRANALFDAHRDDPEFGYRFLVAEAATPASRWPSAPPGGSARPTAGGVPSARSAARTASPDHPCTMIWSAGISPPMRQISCGCPTLLNTAPAKASSTYKDVFSNRIVGYSIDSRMKSRLATTALASAVARRGDVAGCVLHSDRGSEFRSREFVHALHRYDMAGSMGRVGAAGDNAAMESFFGLLQNNVLDRRRWDTREQLRIAIVTWIERPYHRRRRQAGLGRLTPIEFEAIMTTPARQAA